MRGFLGEIDWHLARGERLVRVSVIRAGGSVPREAGAAMLVSDGACRGTIGGGRLELEAIMAARALLGDGEPMTVPWTRVTHTFPLGPSLGQCCGGHVSLLYEHFGPAEAAAIATLAGAAAAEPGAVVVRPLATGGAPLLLASRKQAADVPLSVLRAVRELLSGQRPAGAVVIAGSRAAPGWLIEPAGEPRHALALYGAGHVGRAIVAALAPLPFAITWIDVAEQRFPETRPAGVRIMATPDPASAAASAAPDTLHLVMTFSHALDLAICHAVLDKGAFAYLGLIGSRTKRARFARQLRDAGIGQSALARLTCPIGMPGVPGKQPAMIAVAVAADLLARTHGVLAPAVSLTEDGARSRP